ncbi:UNVERIFIED_CONTAM: Retrovirus-related Pol polyprotein from transposon.6 [Sesamum latifolium]|uniref:Retrovirus-related Pol polyprotein from transposon.6 n=1 Tax=Sesamum latifolium TaxID=2727402 RepID=A0AAW2U2Q1_9LAMI
MCIDFRDLNKACPKDYYPLPRIDQLVDSTSGCELLSMMDASQGYHQIMLAPEDHKRVSFITLDGTFCYVAMPFGLKNAGATYQRLVDKIFRPQLDRNMEVYMDDMLQAFEDVKTYLAKLPLLVKSVLGDTLYLYISSTPQVVSSVLVREEEGKQSPQRGRKSLSTHRENSPGLGHHHKKVASLLHVLSSRGQNQYPLKQVLGKPKISGRLIKWAIELSEYDISYLPRTTIKAQALADFVSEMTGTTQEEVFEERPWLLHVDGSSTAQGSGAGIVLNTPQGDDMEFIVKFEFKASNNEVKYEALVLGMRMTQDVSASHLLSYSDSQLIVK